MGLRGRRRWARWCLALVLATALVALLPGTATASHSSFTAGPVRVSDLFGTLGTSNSATITINDAAAASPYPSDITFNTQGLVVVGVQVQLTRIKHTFPGDIDIQLVGPGGQQVTLMSDAGLDFDIDGNLTFSDDASQLLPQNSQIFTGDAYRPTNYEGTANDGFTSPPSNGNTSLTVFNGVDPAGTWHLYVRDDAAQGVGSISGWGLTLATRPEPYPSVVPVTGLPPSVSDVNVTLHGLSTNRPDDLDLLLVGPDGQQATLMSDVGGSSAVSGVDLTLDDEAASVLADESTLLSGVFKPTNVDTVDFYPPPAPATNGATPLSAFDGLNPNGQWRLFVVDDTAFNDTVTTLAGWSLDFTWSDTAAPAGTVVIAGAAQVVGSAHVTLALNATDPAPASGVTSMRFSNDGSTFSPYQPYAATAPWTLAGGSGTKTVFAQFRDADGNESAVVSDTVVLDVSGPHAKKSSPDAGASQVDRSVVVKVKANEALKGGTVTAGAVVLKQKGGSKVEAKLSYLAGTHQVVLNPKKDLKRHATYVLKVKPSVTDVLGNPWDEKPDKAGAQGLKLTFTTA